MKTFVIEAQQAPSIYSLAGQANREIIFKKGCKYAVVSACYYGYDRYTTHKTVGAAIKASETLKARGECHSIIDSEGNRYAIFNDELDELMAAK